MAPSQNHLIELLPRVAQRRLLALCEPVELVLSQTLCEPGTPTQEVYFPTEGFISLVALNNGTAALEVGMIGREGMLGAQLALGVDTVPLTRTGAGSGPGLAHRQGAVPCGAEAKHGAAQRAATLCLRADGATGCRRGLSALPHDRPAPGALAADES